MPDIDAFEQLIQEYQLEAKFLPKSTRFEPTTPARGVGPPGTPASRARYVPNTPGGLVGSAGSGGFGKARSELNSADILELLTSSDRSATERECAALQEYMLNLELCYSELKMKDALLRRIQDVPLILSNETEVKQIALATSNKESETAECKRRVDETKSAILDAINSIERYEISAANSTAILAEKVIELQDLDSKLSRFKERDTDTQKNLLQELRDDIAKQREELQALEREDIGLQSEFDSTSELEKKSIASMGKAESAFLSSKEKLSRIQVEAAKRDSDIDVMGDWYMQQTKDLKLLQGLRQMVVISPHQISVDFDMKESSAQLALNVRPDDSTLSGYRLELQLQPSIIPLVDISYNANTHCQTVDELFSYAIRTIITRLSASDHLNRTAFLSQSSESSADSDKDVTS